MLCTTVILGVLEMLPKIVWKLPKNLRRAGVTQNIKIILFLFPLQSTFRFVIRLIFAFCSWSRTSNFILFAKSCHYSHCTHWCVNIKICPSFITKINTVELKKSVTLKTRLNMLFTPTMPGKASYSLLMIIFSNKQFQC